MMHALGYVLPSEPQTGLCALLQDVGQVQVGWLFIILQVWYGRLEQFLLSHVSGSFVLCGETLSEKHY